MYSSPYTGCYWDLGATATSRYTCTQCGEDLQKDDFLRDLGISELIHNCERQHPIALEMHHDFQHALGEYLKDVKVGRMRLRISVLFPEKSISKQQNPIGFGGTRK
jgi:hypothetical protein